MIRKTNKKVSMTCSFTYKNLAKGQSMADIYGRILGMIERR